MTDGDIRQIAQAANDAWNEAFNRGDAGAVAACYASDAIILPPTHDVISGARRIAEFWASVIGAGFGRHAIEIVDVQRHGDVAYVAGKWTAIGKGKDGSEQSYGGSLVNVLAAQPDGNWRSKLHIWN